MNPERSKVAQPEFCHVVETNPSGEDRYFVVHAGTPRVVVEMAGGPRDHRAPREAVIRRVRVPNSWAGDYHHCARILDAASASYETAPEAFWSKRR